MIKHKELSIFAIGLLTLVAFHSRNALAEPVALFEDVIISDGAAQRGPPLDMTAKVVRKVSGTGVVFEPMPLTGSERATQPRSDSLEKEKFQTALRLLKDGERLFTNQQFEFAAGRFSAAMALLENLTFDGAIHGLLVSTHIMWGEALVRRGQTSAARRILGDLVALEPSITLSVSDYPNAFLQMLDEVRLQRLQLAQGTIRIRSPRNSVQVSMNETPLGMLPLEVNAIVPGIHVVRFETGTMGGKTRLVRIDAAETVELAFELDTLPSITSIKPGDALANNAIDQVVIKDLLERTISRGAERAIIPLWSFNDGWELSLLELSTDGRATRTKSRSLKVLFEPGMDLKAWWNKRAQLPVSSGWVGVIAERPLRLSLPSWLVGAPAIRSLVSAERIVALRSGARARIDAILSGDEPTPPVSQRDEKRRPLTRAELAKKFEGQSYEATQPISLEDLVLEDERALEPPVWKKWWFWTAVGGVAAAGVTAIILTQDAEPSTVLVGVTWIED